VEVIATNAGVALFSASAALTWFGIRVSAGVECGRFGGGSICAALGSGETLATQLVAGAAVAFVVAFAIEYASDGSAAE